MSEQRKTPVPMLQHRNRQTEQKSAQQGSLLYSSDTNFDIPSGGCQVKVSDFLLYGAENAITGNELIKIMGLTDLRQLTAIIERERKEGVPICANCCEPHGYYLGNQTELEAYIKSLDRRLKNIRLTRTACDETLRRMNGQAQLDGWNDEKM